MKRLALASIAILALTAPTLAAGSIFIPVGPPIYTPQPDIVTPNPDLVVPQDPTVIPQDPTVTTTGGGFEHAPRSEPHQTNPNPTGIGWWNEKCQTFAYVNGDCTVQTMNPGSGSGAAIPVKTIVTANPDLVIPNPDLVIPQAPTVTPQPDLCSQPGISIPGGFGSRDC